VSPEHEAPAVSAPRAALAGPVGVPPDPAALSASQRARRERIVDGALELLMASPYERIQMRDIAEQAGVALGTVYRYFHSKEHLFGDVVVRWAGRLGERVHRRPLRGATNEERLADVYSRAIRAFHLMPQFLTAIRVVESSADPYALRSLGVLADLTEQTYRRALHGVDERDQELIVFACTMVMNGLLTRWMQGGASIEQVNRDMRDTIHLVMGLPGAR